MTFLEEHKLQPLFDECVNEWNKYLAMVFEDQWTKDHQALVKDAEELQFWYSEEFVTKYGNDLMLMTDNNRPDMTDIDSSSWHEVAKAKIENNKVIITDYI